MLLCYVIDSGLSTSLLLLATLIIMFYIYITLHYIGTRLVNELLRLHTAGGHLLSVVQAATTTER